jgi:hypothetical protein
MKVAPQIFSLLQINGIEKCSSKNVPKTQKALKFNPTY